MTISQTIRDKLLKSELTLYRIAKDSGVGWATIKRFHDGTGIHSDHLDKLAVYFDLVLMPATEQRKPGKSKVSKSLKKSKS